MVSDKTILRAKIAEEFTYREREIAEHLHKLYFNYTAFAWHKAHPTEQLKWCYIARDAIYLLGDKGDI